MNRHFEMLFETVAQGVIYHKPTGEFILANPAALRILGLSLKQLQGLTAMNPRWQAIHEDGTPFPGETHPITDALKTGKPIYGIIMGIKNPCVTHTVWIKVNAIPILKEGTSEIDYAYTTLDDITNDLKWQKDLRKSEERFRTMFEQAPLGVALIDSYTGHIYEVNPKFASIAGRSIEELLNIDWISITHPNDVQEDLDNMAKLNAGEISGFHMNKRYIRPDGSYVSISMTIAPLKEADGMHDRHLCMIEDNTELMQSNATLKESELRWKFATEGSGDGMWDWNLQTDKKIFSRRWKEILGYGEMDDPTTFPEWQNRFHPDDKSHVEKTMQDFLDGIASIYTLEFRMLCKDGSYIWVLSRGAAVSIDDAGKALHMVGTLSDITERKNLEFELIKQTRFDYLTGLSNRRHFMEQCEVELSRAIRYDTPLSLMMIDIDFFKNVNDTHGHQAGDSVLKALSKVSEDTLRQFDIIGRLGGEEFSVMLPETTSTEALDVAERLREAVANTEVTSPVGLPIHFTVSIGVTTLHDKNINLDMLLNQADKKMYEAKEAGRNQIRFYAN